MLEIPERVKAFLARPNFAVLATVDPRGRPHATPMWFLLEEDGTLLLNTSQGRAKLRNLRRNPWVALVVYDGGNPYQYVQIRGRVKEISRERGARDIERLARRYTGTAFSYRGGDSPERRVSLLVEPEEVLTNIPR
jgi:PPOX class probable F420-dependent enzyme